MLRLTTLALTEDIKEAQGYADTITDGKLKQQAQDQIEAHQWQNYLRFTTEDLPAKKQSALACYNQAERI